jgi:hypothetical protein
VLAEQPLKREAESLGGAAGGYCASVASGVRWSAGE